MFRGFRVWRFRRFRVRVWEFGGPQVFGVAPRTSNIHMKVCG